MTAQKRMAFQVAPKGQIEYSASGEERQNQICSQAYNTVRVIANFLIPVAWRRKTQNATFPPKDPKQSRLVCTGSLPGNGRVVDLGTNAIRPGHTEREIEIGTKVQGQAKYARLGPTRGVQRGMAVYASECPHCLEPLVEVTGSNLDKCPICGKWFLVHDDGTMVEVV